MSLGIFNSGSFQCKAKHKKSLQFWYTEKCVKITAGYRILLVNGYLLTKIPVWNLLSKQGTRKGY